MSKTLAIVPFLVLGLVACGGGGSKPANDSGPDIPVTETQDDPGTPDVQPDQVRPDVSGPKSLSFVLESDDTNQNCVGKSTCNIWLSFTTQRQVAVKYTAGATPLPSSAIKWEIQEDTKSLGTLEAGQSYTDQDGLATNTIIQNTDNQKPGTFKVKVWVDGDDSVAPLNFLVTVVFKDGPPLSVYLADYKGAYPKLNQYRVRLYKQTAGKPACAEIDATKPPMAEVASPTSEMTATVTFPELPGLETEKTQTWTILALASEGTGPVQAWACDDKQGAVEYGIPTLVQLVLADLPPKITGSYEVTNTFDLASSLPKAIGDVVNIVTGFFTKPTAQIMILMCKTGGTSGFMHDFCGYMFQDPAAPDPEKLTGTGEIIFKIVDTILIALLESQCPFTDKSLCSKIYFTGEDISNIIKKFTIVSTFTFSAEPDANGLLPSTACKEVWHSVKLQWTLGKDCPPTDETCGQMNFSLGAIPGIDNTVSANFDAQLVDKSKLVIKPHKLNLKYGALVNFAIEKVLLPQVFGDGKDGLPAVDTYEKLIGSLLGGKACLKTDDCCATFATNVTKEVSTMTTNLISGACEAIRTAGAGYLRKSLMDLDATPDNFSIGTLEPCQLSDDDNNMTVDTFGKKNAQCKWDATLTISGTDYKPVGTFYGVAK